MSEEVISALFLPQTVRSRAPSPVALRSLSQQFRALAFTSSNPHSDRNAHLERRLLWPSAKQNLGSLQDSRRGSFFPISPRAVWRETGKLVGYPLQFLCDGFCCPWITRHARICPFPALSLTTTHSNRRPSPSPFQIRQGRLHLPWRLNLNLSENCALLSCRPW